ncbi:MAG TPA: MraY family glycosyltransferase, partial [Vicinamibacteria bacterium]|nr:MraY family glycosyltransferase [Vicinamibacteria bacterium]
MATREIAQISSSVPVAFLAGLAAALLLTPAVRRLARRLGWMDRPDGGRKRHSSPVPRVGGLAVYAGFSLAVCAAVALLPEDARSGAGMASAMAHLLAAATPVMLVGLLDDVRGVRPLGKIAVQALSGLYLFLYGYRVARVTDPFGGPALELGWLSLPLTVLWFVAMSNAFNLIDGLDGLAAGVGLFATFTLLVSAVLNERWSMVVVLCALAGALLGFLRYNFSPASVFLGDSGALFVGFVLAGLAIRSSMKATAVVAVGAPLCALALPILDVLLAVTRRLAAGQHVFEADQDHIHHRLIRRGLSPRRAVVSLYGVAAAGASLSLVTLGGSTLVVWASLCAAALLVFAGMRELGYAEFGEFARLLLRRFL